MRQFIFLAFIILSLSLQSQDRIGIDPIAFLTTTKAIHIEYSHQINDQWEIGASVRYNFKRSRDYDPNIDEGRKVNINLQNRLNGGIGWLATYRITPKFGIQYRGLYQSNNQSITSRFATSIAVTPNTVVYQDYTIRNFIRVRQTVTNSLGINMDFPFDKIHLRLFYGASMSVHNDNYEVDPNTDGFVEGINLHTKTFSESFNHFIHRLSNDTKVYPTISIIVAYQI